MSCVEKFAIGFLVGIFRLCMILWKHYFVMLKFVFGFIDLLVQARYFCLAVKILSRFIFRLNLLVTKSYIKNETIGKVF